MVFSLFGSENPSTNSNLSYLNAVVYDLKCCLDYWWFYLFEYNMSVCIRHFGAFRLLFYSNSIFCHLLTWCPASQVFLFSNETSTGSLTYFAVFFESMLWLLFSFYMIHLLFCSFRIYWEYRQDLSYQVWLQLVIFLSQPPASLAFQYLQVVDQVDSA